MRRGRPDLGRYRGRAVIGTARWPAASRMHAERLFRPDFGAVPTLMGFAQPDHSDRRYLYAGSRVSFWCPGAGSLAPSGAGMSLAATHRWRMPCTARPRSKGREMLSHRGQAGVVLSALIAALMVGLAPSGVAQAGPGNQASRVAVITGAQSINDTEARDEIKGTDLGIMWTDERGQILAAFGDTFGGGWTGPGSEAADPAATDWRSNTLARSHDRNPADGMAFSGFVTDHPGHAKELIPSLKRDGVEITTIPTGGINVGGRNYLAYMSVRHFGQPGQWTTNYSGIAYSDDDGQTWVDAPSARQPNTPSFDDKFQMIAYARRDGFVYAFGTPNGHFGDAHLA